MLFIIVRILLAFSHCWLDNSKGISPVKGSAPTICKSLIYDGSAYL